MAEAEHSLHSASGMPRVVRCIGALAMNFGRPRTTSSYAAKGTVQHDIAKWTLQNRVVNGTLASARAYLGQELSADGYTFEITEAMVEAVDSYVDYCMIAARHCSKENKLVEQRLNYSKYLGVPKDDGWGTGDFVYFNDTTIGVVDAKYGEGVKVYASWTDEHGDVHPNEQMASYALGALYEHGLYNDFDKVEMTIHQPYLDHVDEYVMTVAELEAYAERILRTAAQQSRALIGTSPETLMSIGALVPGEKQCKFCVGAACPAAKAEAKEVTVRAAGVADFADLDGPDQLPDVVAHLAEVDNDELAHLYAKRDFVYSIIDAVTAEAERRVIAGERIPDVNAPGEFLKVVEGKQGNRAWSDPEAAKEKLAATFGMKAFTQKIISPKGAEEAAKTHFGGNKTRAAEVMAALAPLITRTAGKPHVTGARDPRPSLDLAAKATDFAELPTVVDAHDPALALPAPGKHPFRR